MIVTRVGLRPRWYTTREKTKGIRVNYAGSRWRNWSIILNRNGGLSKGIRTFWAFTAGIFCEELHESP